MRRVPGFQYIGKPNHVIASITLRLCMLFIHFIPAGILPTSLGPGSIGPALVKPATANTPLTAERRAALRTLLGRPAR